jgi:hypothetical protein
MQEVSQRLTARRVAQAALGYTACDVTRYRACRTRDLTLPNCAHDIVPYVVAIDDAADKGVCGSGTVVRDGDGDWLLLTSAAVLFVSGGAVRFFVERGVPREQQIAVCMDKTSVYRVGTEGVLVRQVEAHAFPSGSRCLLQTSLVACCHDRLLAPAETRAAVWSHVDVARLSDDPLTNRARPLPAHPPLLAELLPAVFEDGLPPVHAEAAWVIGHSRAHGVKCHAVADICDDDASPTLDMSRPTTAFQGMAGAVVFLTSRDDVHRVVTSSWGLVSVATEGRSFGTVCSPKAAMDGPVFLAVSPKACLPCFPTIDDGLLGTVQGAHVNDDTETWAVFASVTCALRARAVLLQAHCTVSRPRPWLAPVVGSVCFSRPMAPMAPIAFSAPLEWVRSAWSDVCKTEHVLMAVTPKGCARVVCDDPEFVGLISGSHAAVATRDKDWMVFTSGAAARRVREKKFACRGFYTSLPQPINDWITTDGYELMRPLP